MLAPRFDVVPSITIGRGHRRHDALTRTDDLIVSTDILEQHGELVATEPRGRVGRTERRLKPARHDGQQLIARRVAKTVVDAP